MIELDHALSEPPELARFRRRYPDASWGEPEFGAIKPVVQRQLHFEQAGLCVYCEGSLAVDEGHLEHIQPRSAVPDRTFEYTNLAHSCNGSTPPQHCGHWKADRPLPVEPRIECNQFFSFIGSDGNVVPAMGLSPEDRERARGTIDVLGLNVPRLAHARRRYYEAARYLADSDRDDFLQSQPFRWTLRRAFPKSS